MSNETWCLPEELYIVIGNKVTGINDGVLLMNVKHLKGNKKEIFKL